tara:strand:- start:883 stop:1854 length:972 start_codon:yes stop_codon:yes gene_type:complete
MPSYNEIEALANRAAELREYITSEEGSKTCLVLPMLGALGYDVFNPKQITAELTADVGVKRGEKVDYAIMSSGKPKLIIECKKIGDPLGTAAISQLFRYFTSLRVKFGVLTNGIIYQFYTDMDTPNIMDSSPFFEFNLLAYTQTDVEFLDRFRKGCLSGQMKSLVRECKRRKLVAIIRDTIRYSSQCTDEFIEDIKKTLVKTNLASVTKKDMANIIRRVSLEEAIKVVESNLKVDVLKTHLNSILVSVLGKDIANMISYRLTANSVYLESKTGTTLVRVFSSGLDLRVSFSNGSSAKAIRVIEDIRRYSEELQECLTLEKLRN